MRRLLLVLYFVVMPSSSVLCPSCVHGQVKNSNFTVFISDFTTNTYIMVVTTSNLVEKATTELNINAAKRHFDRLLGQPGQLGHHIPGQVG